MNPITGNNRFARSSSGPDNLVCRFFPGTANHLGLQVPSPEGQSA